MTSRGSDGDGMDAGFLREFTDRETLRENNPSILLKEDIAKILR